MDNYPYFYNKFDKSIPWIKDSTIYLAIHGSTAYGTNTPESDVDFRGICVPPKKYYFGSSNFEQAELHDPDVTIFEIRKFFRLATDANPNALEILFVNDKHVLYADELGKMVRDNRDLFLSKKIKHTMTGYAMSQLKRINTHRRWLLNPPTKFPTRNEMGLPEQTLIPTDQLMAVSAEIKKEMDKFNFDFTGLDEATKIEIRNTFDSILSELKITTDDKWNFVAKKIGLDDNLIYVMNKEREYAAKKKEWDQYQNWKQNRNPKRAELEAKYLVDTKHASHLVRLMCMCKEALLTGKLNVHRADAEQLLAIRNGAWSYEDIIEFVDKEEKIINDIYKSFNVLPNEPDRKKIDNLCIDIVDRFTSKYSMYNLKKKFSDIF